MSSVSSLDLALKQIVSARAYLHTLLEGIEDELWFQIPERAVSHIGWQVGHLAMAQYGLCLFRVRGRQPEDLELMSSRFRKKYGRGSTPDPDPAGNPAPAELREALERVYQQVLKELPQVTEEVLAEPADEPYFGYPTKLGAILFAPAHEMLHAGQIGTLRRQLGKPPVR